MDEETKGAVEMELGLGKAHKKMDGEGCYTVEWASRNQKNAENRAEKKNRSCIVRHSRKPEPEARIRPGLGSSVAARTEADNRIRTRELHSCPLRSRKQNEDTGAP